ncbi:MAG: major facilitator superfamily domain-containing protein [Piptocephalis tieghemiana]|nr:MAG: major facilitator superfamily domain-containing protein [Piptocephalis tieghemiana]
MSLPRLEGRPASSVYLPLATLSPRENWSPTEEEGSEEEERPVKGNTPSTYQYTALICACLIGTGSHFANHTIGPLKPYLKEELDLDNTHFGTLQASLSLLSTLTPLGGGWMADQMGIGPSAVLSSLIILLGQACVAIGVDARSFSIVLAGYCIQSVGSGGVIPVLEAMLSRTYDHQHLSTTLGFYLSFGKLVCPFNALKDQPPTHLFLFILMMDLGTTRDSPSEPTAWSTSASPLEPSTASPLTPTTCPLASSGIDASPLFEEEEEEEEEEDMERNMLSSSSSTLVQPKVPLTTILTLPVIWYLIATCLLGACWTPFLHLSTTIFTEVQGIPEETAAWLSSSILALPILGNPILGYGMKKLPCLHPRMVIILGSLLTSLSFFPLFIQPSTSLNLSPVILSSLCMALALSCTPLSLVAVVPTLRTSQVGLLLGLHRVVDMAGSVGMSVGAGLLQDAQSGRYQPVLKTWSILGALALVTSLTFPTPGPFWDRPGKGVRMLGVLVILVPVILAWFLFIYGSILHPSLARGSGQHPLAKGE